MSSGTRTTVVTVALMTVAVVYALDRLVELDWSDGAVVPVRIVVLAAAVVIAGVSFQVWSTGEPQAPRPLGAMVTALIGGASLASVVTSAGSGQVLARGALASVAVVALTFAVIVLNLDARESDGR